MVKKNDICGAIKRIGICGNPIINNGVESSGFCEHCWNSTIVEQHKHYFELRAEGYDKIPAAVLAHILHDENTARKLRSSVIVESKRRKYANSEASADDLIKPAKSLGWVAPVNGDTYGG
jgi:hypothetical protein